MHRDSLRYTGHYSLIQTAYWLSSGAFFGFNTVYLTARGVDLPQIGYLVAACNALSVGLQLSVSSLLSKVNLGKNALKTTVIIMATLSLSSALALPLIKTESIVPVLALFFLAYVFATAQSPFITSISMECINRGKPLNFGFARGIGSVAYAAASFIMGRMIAVYGSSYLPFIHSGFYVVMIFLLLAFKLPETNVRIPMEREKGAGAPGFIRRYGQFMFFLVGVICIVFCSRIVSTYLIRIIEGVGGDSSDLGAVAAIAALVEFPVMVTFTRLTLKVKIESILRFACVFYSIKAATLIFAPALGFVYFGHFLQVFAYALFLPAFTFYINSTMEDEDRLMGQSLGTAAMTFGDVLGALFCGLLPLQFGVSMNNLLLVGLSVSCLGSVLVIIAFTRKRKKEEHV